MIFLEKQPLTIAEVKEYLAKSDAVENKAMTDYIKKFGKSTKDKSEKIAKEIRDLNNPKVKEDHIVKVVDFMPDDVEDVNKIFNDVSLTEDEAKTILEIVKKH